MKKSILDVTKTFRCSRRLSERINQIALDSNEHVSDLIRDAVAFYIEHLQEDTTPPRGLR